VISLIERCQTGVASQFPYDKGSETIPVVFPYGTFFRERPTLDNIATIVADAKDLLRKNFALEGLEVDIKQGRAAGLAFILTLVGNANRFRFLDGNWFRSTIEISIFDRAEPNLPAGMVQQVDLHVIGTKIFHAPSSVHPKPSQFQPIARVDRTLDDDVVDG